MPTPQQRSPSISPQPKNPNRHHFDPSLHGCGIPSCGSFLAPVYTVLNPRACLIVVQGKHGKRFAYYSQRRDLLMLQKAPKPLLLVPEIAAEKGFELDSEDAGEIKLNHCFYEGAPTVRRSRRGTKVGPSKLRNEVLPEEVVDSPPAKKEGTALSQRETPNNAAVSQQSSITTSTSTAIHTSITEPTTTEDYDESSEEEEVNCPTR